ncbi:hypothetical protein ACUWUW_004334, partial [Vibrio vulnificus]
MEVFYLVIIIVVMAIFTGLISRYYLIIQHFFKAVGWIKVLVFLTLSIWLFFVALSQENGVSSVILPTILGLALNGLIFTVFLDYMKIRTVEKDELSKIAVMNELIGNSVYYFQTANGIDLESYKDGRKLQYVQQSTIEKLFNHYKGSKKLSQSEVEYFAALGQRLSNHLPIYTSMLTSTYSVDSNLARVWTEIVFSMESLASIL